MKARFWFRMHHKLGVDPVVTVHISPSDNARAIAHRALRVLWLETDLQPADVRVITGRYLPDAA